MKSAQARPSHTHNNHADDADEDRQEDRYYDRSFDHVARVRAAKEAAQRRMEEFGDISEYDVTIIQGQLKEEPEHDAQPSLDFEREGEN
jgi:hypothetical protein